jgi:hypothetical protein
MAPALSMNLCFSLNVNPNLNLALPVSFAPTL